MKVEGLEFTAPGWVRDEDGVLRREAIHRMGRRAKNWDYRGRGAYLITIAAATRGRGVWGEVVVDALASERAPTFKEGGRFIASERAPTIKESGRFTASERAHTFKEGGRFTAIERAPTFKEGGRFTASALAPTVGTAPLAATRGFERVGAATLAARFKPNRLGEIVARAWAELEANWPGVKLVASQVMEDHFHGVLLTPSYMAKPLGAIIGSLKARASSAYAKTLLPDKGAAGASLWAKGYVDTILVGEEALEKAIAYVEDNPRRLAIKRLNPELFKVLREVKVAQVGRFSAIGNAFLLKAPRIFQVQCSRSDFAYARNAKGEIEKEEPPRLKTARFDEKLAELKDEIEHGAVVLSPCISEGERELARVAFEQGARVITLQNKGFSPLYKPGGKLFEPCANGRLLLLAPINWPYQPGEKKMTRFDACTLNRIAQLIAGPGAAQINYKGVKIADVDRLVLAAVDDGGEKV